MTLESSEVMCRTIWVPYRRCATFLHTTVQYDSARAHCFMLHSTAYDDKSIAHRTKSQPRQTNRKASATKEKEGDGNGNGYASPHPEANARAYNELRCYKQCKGAGDEWRCCCLFAQRLVPRFSPGSHHVNICHPQLHGGGGYIHILQNEINIGFQKYPKHVCVKRNEYFLLQNDR